MTEGKGRLFLITILIYNAHKPLITCDAASGTRG